MKILAFLGVSILAFGGWYLSRTINYSLSYESMVESTVKDVVKQSCIKEGLSE
jgi:hypothetical protein